MAVTNGRELEKAVADLGRKLELDVRTSAKVGKRIWGAQRHIDVVLTHPTTRVRLGLECKYQESAGTVEEKISSTLEDIKAWPIKGLVVIAGPGFSANMRGYLTSTGLVVDFEDLEEWLRMFFGL
ncbi:MAG: PD-(D/E)XK nuclease superfamily protein [Anaerolineae bacterium]